MCWIDAWVIKEIEERKVQSRKAGEYVSRPDLA